MANNSVFDEQFYLSQYADVREAVKAAFFRWVTPIIPKALLVTYRGIDRDRGTPRDATPPTPPGIRVPYHGGSTELGLGGRIDSGKTERLEIVVA